MGENLPKGCRSPAPILSVVAYGAASICTAHEHAHPVHVKAMKLSSVNSPIDFARIWFIWNGGPGGNQTYNPSIQNCSLKTILRVASLDRDSHFTYGRDGNVSGADSSALVRVRLTTVMSSCWPNCLAASAMVSAVWLLTAWVRSNP